MADRKISDLTALTTPASGDYLPIVDISEAAAASKNKRVTVQSLFQGIPVNVGIGTSSPQSLLNLSTPSTGTSTESLRIEGGQRSSDSFATGFRVYTESTTSDSNRHLRIVCNGSTGFSIQPYETSSGNAAVDSNLYLCPAGGNVGIGTSSPGNQLHVAQDFNGNTATRVSNSNTGGSAYSSLYIQGSSVTTELSQNSVNRTFLAGANGFYINTGASSPLAFAQNGTARLYIDSSGRVGIGTSSPGSLLDLRFATSPATDNGDGFNALRVFTSSALAADTGGAISLGGVSTSGGATAAWGQIAGRKENATSANYAGYLQFATNSGVGTMSERMRIDSSGNVGIGTSSPDSTLHVLAGAVAGFRIGYNNTSVNYYDADTQIFRNIAGAERARIDSSGRLLIGTSSAVILAPLEVNGNGSFGNYQDNDFCSGLRLYKSKSGTAGTQGLVANNTQLGDVRFLGSDGSSFVQGAVIRAEVDGTPGTNDMPGRLVFSTTADGASSPTERVRIDSQGRVGIGTTAPTTLLDVNADTVRVRTARTPASATATGATGEICWDASYIYVCTATNTWKRAALSTW